MKKISCSLIYWINNNVYISITNKLNSNSFLKLRGPSFILPSFQEQQLKQQEEEIEEDKEPKIEDIINIINKLYDNNEIQISSMKSEMITFAGLGDPLFRLDDICDITKTIHENRHGVPFRIKTNGLLANNPEEVASKLYDARIKEISISLMTDNPKQYLEIMQPKDPNVGFHTACNFILACVDKGLNVTCTAVERPDVNISRVRALSYSLGASKFTSYTYHP